MFTRKLGKDRAAVKFRISTSALLTVLVLLTIGLFGESLQNSVENLCAKIFSNNNLNMISENNVNYYLSQSQTIINKYKKSVASSDKQLEELAKAVTIAKIAGKLTPKDENFIYLTYRIDVDTRTNITYIKDEKKLAFNEQELYLKTDKNKLAAIKEVAAGKFS